MRGHFKPVRRVNRRFDKDHQRKYYHVSANISAELAGVFDEFRKRNGYITNTEAIRLLIKRAGQSMMRDF